MTPSPRHALTLLAALIGATFAAPGHAGNPANVITVTTTSDSMDAFDQACSLREALANANTNTQFSPVVGECPAGSGALTDEVRLQGGATYALTLAGADDEGGDLDVHDDAGLAADVPDVHLDAVGDGNATIDQQVAGERVLHNDGAVLHVSGVNIEGGATAEVGGGIYNDGGTMSLHALVVRNNSAVSGGGIYTEGDVTIDDLWITDNSAELIGGGIFHGDGPMSIVDTGIDDNSASGGAGLYAFNGSVVAVDSNISGNTASSDGGGILSTGDNALVLTNVDLGGNVSQGSGGALYSDSSEDVTLNQSDFTDNEAAVHGGAVRAAGEVIVDGGLFSGNQATESGGAIHSGRLIADGAVFTGNEAGEDGGGVHVQIGCQLDDVLVASNSAQRNGGGAHCQIARLTRTRVRENLAFERGGGIYANNFVIIRESAIESNTGLVDGGGLWLTPANFDSEISRTLFAGNTALNDGAGAWLGADERIVTFANSTFSGNIASFGSGSGLYIDSGSTTFAYNSTFSGNGPGETIAKYGKLTLQNSILHSPAPTALDCVAALDDPAIISLGYNIASDDSCVGLDATGDVTETDPLLAPLANNGGGTRTHALLDGSPAIDAGLDSGCQGLLVGGVDQRGAERPETGCDIGAHEQEVELAAIFADGFED